MEEINERGTTEAEAKAADFANQMRKFSTYFYLASLLKVYSVIGTVNQALQSSSLQFQQANVLLHNLKCLLQSNRDTFHSFGLKLYAKPMKLASKHPFCHVCDEHQDVSTTEVTRTSFQRQRRIISNSFWR